MRSLLQSGDARTKSVTRIDANMNENKNKDTSPSEDNESATTKALEIALVQANTKIELLEQQLKEANEDRAQLRQMLDFVKRRVGDLDHAALEQAFHYLKTKHIALLKALEAAKFLLEPFLDGGTYNGSSDEKQDRGSDSG